MRYAKLIKRLEDSARNCDSQPPNVQASWDKTKQIEWEAAQAIRTLVKERYK